MAIKKRHEEHENHERWLVSYADFITLLFAFFTVMYATSQSDVEKQEEFEKSIKRQLIGIFGSGVQGGGSGSGTGDFQLSQPNLMADAFPGHGASRAEVQNYVERKLQGENGVNGVNHDALGVRIQLAANKLFASGSAELLEGSLSALDEIGKLLKESRRKLIVEGHTDDHPIHTSRYPSNWELSAARATKVVRYLIARSGIPATKLTAVAYAEHKPVVANDSELHRAQNRRIEILIVTGQNKQTNSVE